MIHCNLGGILIERGDCEGGEAALREALRLKPDFPNVDILLAMCLSEVGQYEEALPGLRKGFGQGGDSPMRRATGPIGWTSSFPT